MKKCVNKNQPYIKHNQEGIPEQNVFVQKIGLHVGTRGREEMENVQADQQQCSAAKFGLLQLLEAYHY